MNEDYFCYKSSRLNADVCRVVSTLWFGAGKQWAHPLEMYYRGLVFMRKEGDQARARPQPSPLSLSPTFIRANIKREGLRAHPVCQDTFCDLLIYHQVYSMSMRAPWWEETNYANYRIPSQRCSERRTQTFLDGGFGWVKL